MSGGRLFRDHALVEKAGHARGQAKRPHFPQFWVKEFAVRAGSDMLKCNKGEIALSALSRLLVTAYGLAALIAAEDGHAQAAQGENYSAKPPAVLFSSDCTGSGCHNGPQGLAKGKNAGTLTDYLREHYTNSRQSAAALAGYLLGVPGANNARAARPGRESSTRETSKREPPAREEPKREESQSIFPSLPSISIFSSPSSAPETARRDESPAQPQSRPGRREEAAPSSRTTTVRRDDAAKPAGERDGAKPARSRSRQPSHQLPKIEDPNSPNENDIYRPARSRQPPQQPRSEDGAKPAETAVTNAPTSAPTNVPANVPSTTATAAPHAPPTQIPRSRARTPAAESGGAAPTEPAKPATARASQRQPSTAASSSSAPQGASPSRQSAPPKTPVVPREQIFD
jgi:hypothetical protein